MLCPHRAWLLHARVAAVRNPALRKVQLAHTRATSLARGGMLQVQSCLLMRCLACRHAQLARSLPRSCSQHQGALLCLEPSMRCASLGHVPCAMLAHGSDLQASPCHAPHDRPCAADVRPLGGTRAPADECCRVQLCAALFVAGKVLAYLSPVSIALLCANPLHFQISRSLRTCHVLVLCARSDFGWFQNCAPSLQYADCWQVTYNPMLPCRRDLEQSAASMNDASCATQAW